MIVRFVEVQFAFILNLVVQEHIPKDVDAG